MAASVLLISGTSQAVTIDWVPVRNAGNAADVLYTQNNPGNLQFGAVDYNYSISKYETTNAQYVEFLNAVADTDTNSLYNTNMNTEVRGGITRSGTSGSYSYAAKIGWENSPVVYVSFYDSLRFANWLHNGQPMGLQSNLTTEDGAYTITPAGIAANNITRNPGAQVFLPSEDEWYKAAYHKNDGVTGNYWLYPMQTSNVSEVHSDQPPGSGAIAPAYYGNFYLDDTIANGYDDGYAVTGTSPAVPAPAVNLLTDVGAYTESPGPYGTFDQGGNVREWNEAIIGAERGVRGGSWNIGTTYLRAAYRDGSEDPSSYQARSAGFRVATYYVVPEPGTLVLGVIGGMMLMLCCRRRFQKSTV